MHTVTRTDNPELLGQTLEALLTSAQHLYHEVHHHSHEHVPQPEEQPLEGHGFHVDGEAVLHLIMVMKHLTTHLERQLYDVCKTSIMRNPKAKFWYRAVVIFYRGNLRSIQFAKTDHSLEETIQAFMMDELVGETMERALLAAKEFKGNKQKIQEAADEFMTEQFGKIALWAISDNGRGFIQPHTKVRYGGGYTPTQLKEMETKAIEELMSGGSLDVH